MADAIKSYVSKLGIRNTTRAQYERILYRFAALAGSRGPLSTDAGVEFVTRARCARTRNLYLVVINAFRSSCRRDPLPLDRARAQRKTFNTARIAETFDALLPRCKSERDRALLALLRFGGLRISEALYLRVRDISFPDGQLQVAITESKTVPRDPIAWRATRYMRDYLDRTRAGSDRYLFPTPSGRPLTRQTFEWWLAKESLAAGYRISPHDLRRLCATEMAGKFGLQVLMDYFGWESAATAQIYIDKARGSSGSAIRSELGITNKSSLFDTNKCWRCGAASPPEQQHCGTCGELLDQDAIPQRERVKQMGDKELEDLLVQILEKRGILPSRS